EGCEIMKMIRRQSSTSTSGVTLISTNGSSSSPSPPTETDMNGGSYSLAPLASSGAAGGATHPGGARRGSQVEPGRDPPIRAGSPVHGAARVRTVGRAMAARAHVRAVLRLCRTLRNDDLSPMWTQRIAAAGGVPGPLAQLRGRRPVRNLARDDPACVRSRRDPFRSGEQLRAAPRFD